MEEGTCTQGKEFKVCWDFEYKMRKTSIARRPDMTLKDVREKRIWIVGMSCPQKKNVEEVTRNKMQKYQQLAFDTRGKRPGYAVKVALVIIGCLGGGVEKTGKVVAKLMEGKRNVIRTVRAMQRTILLEGETIVREVLSGIILYYLSYCN